MVEVYLYSYNNFRRKTNLPPENINDEDAKFIIENNVIVSIEEFAPDNPLRDKVALYAWVPGKISQDDEICILEPWSNSPEERRNCLHKLVEAVKKELEKYE